MHTIFRSCDLCLVLAAGLGRLARLNEEITWAKRAKHYKKPWSPR
jgi:hypothetical protein